MSLLGSGGNGGETPDPPKYSEGHFVTSHELPVEPHLAICELVSARLRVTCAAALIVELLRDDLDDDITHLFTGD